jgi:hypothetical protein
MLVKNKAYNSQEIDQSLKNSENLGKILEIKEFFSSTNKNKEHNIQQTETKNIQQTRTKNIQQTRTKNIPYNKQKQK